MKWKVVENAQIVPRLISSAPDFGNLSCHQITGTTLNNTNIEIRNTKQYRNTNFQNSKQNLMIRPFLVLVIDVFVICICFEFRYSNFGFSRPPQMGEIYESIRIFHVAILGH
jgi:hypothetical protein